VFFQKLRVSAITQKIFGDVTQMRCGCIVSAKEIEKAFRLPEIARNIVNEILRTLVFGFRSQKYGKNIGFLKAVKRSDQTKAIHQIPSLSFFGQNNRRCIRFHDLKNLSFQNFDTIFTQYHCIPSFMNFQENSFDLFRCHSTDGSHLCPFYVFFRNPTSKSTVFPNDFFENIDKPPANGL
jgi:hypothetical protein